MAKDLFGDVWGSVSKHKQPKLLAAAKRDPDLDRVLAWLREGPKHRDWLRVRVTNPKKVIDALCAEGHVVKAVLFYQRFEWVYCLQENGQLCGITGRLGYDVADVVMAHGNLPKLPTPKRKRK